MQGYLFHGDGAGAWQLSESESKALADFVLSHQEIATIIVYGHHDTLSIPMKEDGKDKAGAPKKLMNFKWITHLPLQKAVIYFLILIAIFMLILALIF